VEPLAALLMRALYAGGHKAQALDQYAETRRRLVEELGSEPGAELRELHRAILRDDLPQHAAVSAAAHRSGYVARYLPVPAQLPKDVRGFVAREEELRRLDAILAAAASEPTAVPVCALSGTAGVGKTALAVHWAHLVPIGSRTGSCTRTCAASTRPGPCWRRPTRSGASSRRSACRRDRRRPMWTLRPGSTGACSPDGGC
jgi:Bacterial transcriptional activator domain